MKLRGFTIIELLVVIAVIGMLASITLVSLQSARDKAKRGRAEEELAQFLGVAVAAQQETGKTLQQITGSGCSNCACRNRNIQNIPDTDSCAQNWYNVLSTIQAASGITTNLTEMRRDGWNAPYALDENEMEFGPADCRYDDILSAGPDGFTGTGDDYQVIIPHVICPQ